jgi:hypothetical protein
MALNLNRNQSAIIFVDWSYTYSATGDEPNNSLVLLKTGSGNLI